MATLTLGDFTRASHQLNRTAQTLLYQTSGIVREDELLFFYPKNVLSSKEEDPQEIILGTKNGKICRIQVANGECKTEVFNKENIQKLEHVINLETENVLLKIIFKYEDVIVLDSSVDGNRDWEAKYKGRIEEIFNLLSA